MKNQLTLLLLIMLVANSERVTATNYYFSTTDGDDSRTSAQAQSAATPWKTLSKLNSIFSSLQPGDAVLFKRGDIFYGRININKAGAVGNPITIGAYGTGENPVITGFSSVTAWVSYSPNIWESVNAVSTLSTLNMVVINNTNIPMGRYPNTGYLTYTSPTTTTKTVAALNSAVTNWTGARAVMRLYHWITDNNVITAQSGSVITHTTTPNPTSYTGISGYGLFIENDTRTLDQQNEWYYDPTTKKLRVFSITVPNVRVTTIDTLVTMPSNRGNITIENIKFTGSNKNTFVIKSCPNVTIQNCQFDFAGQDCIWGGQNGGSPFSDNFKFLNNTINHTNNNAIILREEFTSALIQNNTINNTALQPGMGKGGDGQMMAIRVQANGTIIEKNTIDSTGYIPIYFLGNNVQIRYNFITEFNRTKMDGGGIYTWLGPGTPNTGCRIHHNIILNSYPSTDGTNQPFGLSHGIYMDANTANIQIDSNTVANLSYSGLYLYSGASTNNIFGNTFYNCGVTQELHSNQFTFGKQTLNNTITNNIFFSKASTQKVLKVTTRDALSAYTSSMGTFTNNYYARPIDDATATTTFFMISNNNSTFNDMGLATWKSTTGNDVGSQKSPISVSTVNDIRFEYNETASNKVVSLGANYIDVRGVSYNGSITLAPYSSAVLIYTSGVVANQPPVANAGPDQNFFFPTSSTTVTGSGVDADGTIASYQWSKVSGPSQFTIAFPTQAQTAINNLAAGIYQFELKVTDNSGSTDRDTMTITVNAASNQPPVANAGLDINITMPLSSVTLNGSGTDPDGSIASYQWTKISGPTQYSIASSNQAQTAVTNLTTGIYSFELKVTDNSGAIDRDTAQVIVNAAPPNLPPTANAGSDINITLPTNNVTLSGSGSDPDGTIASYQWTKTSGPSQYAIGSSTQSQTSVTNLTQGTYTFELTVTDNNGATAKDAIQVTVNAAPPNQPPTANAGSDINITLPTNNVTLSGSGSDPDGTIASYQWTKTSGPSQYTIGSGTQSQTSVTNLTQGVYTFELTVTDNSGATAKDAIQVTVNAAPNQTPIGDAGSDITITLPTNTIKLLGGGNDPDGTISSYQWTKISGPTQFTIVSGTQAQSTVNNLVQGVYLFELRVTDNSGATDQDTVQVTVNPAPPNEPPSTYAGSDISITLPTNSVTLSGIAADPDGTISTYRWTKISGPSQYSIISSSQAQTTVNNLVAGIYSFELTVTDDGGATGKDTVQVTVNPEIINQSPSADAGLDINITLPVNTVILSGGGVDPDGSIASYQWTKISGPTQYTILSSNQAQTTANNLVQGSYMFELKVTDNQGSTAKDTVTVNVNPAPNQPPAADAGPDIIITLPNNSVTLSGSGDDPDGTISAYRWAKIAGPGQYSITSSNQAQTTVDNLVQGIYLFEFRVTDNQGTSTRDTIQVTVNAAPPNQPPTANAGADINITLPANSATLPGSGTDPDGTISAYQWTKISGPSQYTIASANQALTSVNNLVQGVYTFELKVTDNTGATANDTVQVTVNAAAPPPNQLPTANAGADINITLPLDSAMLNGSGTDPDGTIASYQWTKISGPSQYTVVTPAQASTTVDNLGEGVYKFELKVTDSSGAVGKDTVQVTVRTAQSDNQSPVANAGPDVEITLPNTNAILSGSGSDPDGTIVSYQWTKISGSSAYSISSATDAQITLSDLVPGQYEFQLTVTDNSGATGKDTVEITVNENLKSKAKVFPNPAKATINLQIHSVTKTDNTILRIYDAQGCLVYQENFVRTRQTMTKQVDISKLPNGVYSVEMNLEINKITTLMFVKQ
jgi:hypothetical protein